MIILVYIALLFLIFWLFAQARTDSHQRTIEVRTVDKQTGEVTVSYRKVKDKQTASQKAASDTIEVLRNAVLYVGAFLGIVAFVVLFVSMVRG
ncbi:MAG: hypothetical protein HRU19_24805 [Pseudobacteriovorax sp.]|nr:hypothetical protein [Pseudobacteriovorax sp.]